MIAAYVSSWYLRSREGQRGIRFRPLITRAILALAHCNTVSPKLYGATVESRRRSSGKLRSKARIPTCLFSPPLHSVFFIQTPTRSIAMEPLTENERTKSKSKGLRIRCCSKIDWWQEIGSCLFSVLCLLGMVMLFSRIRNRPLTSWSFIVSPNACISILSTASKACLILPVSECISQLKRIYLLEFKLRTVSLAGFMYVEDRAGCHWTDLSEHFSYHNRQVKKQTNACCLLQFQY